MQVILQPRWRGGTVASDDVQQMSTREYFSYLDRGAAATTAQDVQHLRTELMHCWRDDPRAEDLTETLYAHQEQLAARENTVLGEGDRR